MSNVQDLVWMLPVLLYAETHYRFKYFFSFLRKREPEVIADVPHRLQPGTPIPLLLIAKDAHNFPASLGPVKVTVRQQGRTEQEIELIRDPVSLHDPLWWHAYELPRNDLQGWIDLDVQMTITVNGRSRTYTSDNHRTSTQLPLKVFLSAEPLPTQEKLFLGDAHTHSDRTSDQVEFGVPIKAARKLSESLGLSFFCVADHSYDLDDSLEDFIRNDPALPKWVSLINEIKQCNAERDGFVVVQGEEVSCRNSKGRNVHLLLFGDERFFHGTGDGAERWLRTRCEYSADDVLSQKDEHAVAFSAHPREPVSLLQRVLLGRGSWSDEDVRHKRLSGIQFANGIKTSGFEEGYQLWTRMLLEGHQLFCIAGNDAHGNFNRFRQIGIPFLKVRESDDQLFGKMRTGVFVEGQLGQNSLLESLADGKCIATDGPVANILVQGSDKITSLGSKLSGSKFEFFFSARSSKEFGSLDEVRLILGVIGERFERDFFVKNMNDRFDFQHLATIHISSPSYLRAEVHTSSSNLSDHSSHFCYSNPVWFTP